MSFLPSVANTTAMQAGAFHAMPLRGIAECNSIGQLRAHDMHTEEFESPHSVAHDSLSHGFHVRVRPGLQLGTALPKIF